MHAAAAWNPGLHLRKGCCSPGLGLKLGKELLNWRAKLLQDCQLHLLKSTGLGPILQDLQLPAEHAPLTTAVLQLSH